MTISTKLLLTTFGLCIPFITLTSEKPHHQTAHSYSISTFNSERDAELMVNLFKNEHYSLTNASPKNYIQEHCGYNTTCKVLYDNDQFAGFIAYKQNCIDYLVIEPNFRNKGYGKKLLTHAIDDLSHRKSPNTIEICARNNNIAALALYKKNGFKTRTYKSKRFTCLEYNPSDIQDYLFDQHSKAYQY